MTSRGRVVWKAAWMFCCLSQILNIGIAESHDLDDKSIDYYSHQKKDNVQGQLSYLQTQLGTILEWSVSMDHRLSALEHRITALEYRVTSPDQRLSDLAQSHGQLKSPFNSGEKLQNDVGIHEKPSKMERLEGLEDIPFRLTLVRQMDTGHVYIVTLHYRASTAPDILLKINSYPAKIRSEDMGLGVVTVYIPKAEQNSPEPWIYFVFPEYFISVRLDLTSSSEMYMPVVSLKIEQGNDIIFQSGHNAQLTFEFYVNDPQTIESERAFIQFLTKSDKKKHTVDRHHLFFLNSEHTNSAGNMQLNLIGMEGSKGNWKGALAINSSNDDAEGIMEAFITINFNCSVNCLVKQMTKQHHIKVHRADHLGPFPQDFIGFVRDDYKRNATHVLCDLDPHAKPCAILCEVAGNRVTSVQIQKVGSLGVESSRLLTAGKGGYWGSAMMTFDQLRMEDGGEYVCTAISGENEISERVFLQVQRSLED